MASQPHIAFPVSTEPTPRRRIAIHVNFGVFTGRDVTAAEIDRLAADLLDRVQYVTIVSEVRRELDRHSSASVHQVLIEVPSREHGAAGGEELEEWLVYEAERWARACGTERTLGIVRTGPSL